MMKMMYLIIKICIFSNLFLLFIVGISKGALKRLSYLECKY